MSDAGLLIRPSRDDDVATITAIYGHHVLHGVASFEEVPPSEVEMARRRAEIIGRDLPYLVAERDGKVVGYCYAGPYRTRVAYRFSVEVRSISTPARSDAASAALCSPRSSSARPSLAIAR